MLASWLATARSGLPSPLKSPTATDAGPSPVSTLAAGPKLAAVSAIAGDATRAANRVPTTRTARRMHRINFPEPETVVVDPTNCPRHPATPGLTLEILERELASERGPTARRPARRRPANR